MSSDDFDKLLDAKLAKFFGQMSMHFDERLEAEIGPLRSDLHQVRSTLDGLAKRLETDEQERAAIGWEQERHRAWIAQLAKTTGTKLVPEQ